MNEADICELLSPVREIAQEAGRRILDVYERDFEAEEKEDGSPLTEADQVSHRYIAARLAELTPEIPLLSEEQAAIDPAERRRWTRFWCVDPLDGTKEFINRNGEFTVNIALVVGTEPVLGVLYVPAKGLTYSGCRGSGAWRQEVNGAPQQIRAGAYSGGPARVVASRSHAGEHLAEFLAALEAREGEFDTLSMGSALKFCLVADGSADLYPRLGPTSEWDTAAAQCVVECAGGRVITADGKPLAYNKTSLLNPWFLVEDAGDYAWRELLPGA
ncbi:MAG: 3'(2'),5'-bisphosphate nucleotidase CysQ [Gammaproteobacteria bacterium]|nr:3'(2'),5'-bisphosphate nucleotidase CysQ [Gammaproteobacteria bacterium]